MKEFNGTALGDHAGRKVQPGKSQMGRIHDGFMDGSMVIFLPHVVDSLIHNLSKLNISFEIQLELKDEF